MYLCHLKKDFWGTRHRHFLWPSTPFSIISSHWPPVVMINVVPFFFGVSDDPIPWTKKKGMVYHSYPMILPFLISLSCSKMIPYSEVFITWFHGKILRFYGKIPTFPCSTGKKNTFPFFHRFFPLFLWCLGWSSPTQKTMAWKRACQPRGRPRGKRGRSALANGVFRGGHPKGDNTLNHSYIYIML